MLEAPLLWQKDQAIAQAQYSERRTCTQAEVLAKLLRDGQLALFADLGSG